MRMPRNARAARDPGSGTRPRPWSLLLLGTAALALAGCSSGREQALHAAIQDGATCRTMGARPGTPVYDRCRRAQARARAEEDAPAD